MAVLKPFPFADSFENICRNGFLWMGQRSSGTVWLFLSLGKGGGRVPFLPGKTPFRQKYAFPCKGLLTAGHPGW